MQSTSFFLSVLRVESDDDVNAIGCRVISLQQKGITRKYIKGILVAVNEKVHVGPFFLF